MAASAVEQQAAADDAESELSGVMYIGHLPYGFFEEELASYFSQFGSLLRLRLSRNPKTGRSRGYAFIEFKYPEVARVAAQTMDGYFMFGNKLVCQVLKHQELHKRMFFKWRKKMHNRRRGHTKRAQEAHNRERSEDEQAAQVKKLIAKDAHRQKRILEMGIDYHYSGFKDVAAPPGKKRRLQGDGGASVPSAGAKRDDAMITNDECLDLSDLELEEDGCQMDEASDLENDCEAMAGAVPITISKGKSHSSEGGVPHAKAVRVGKKKGSKPPGKGEKRNDMPQRHASHERGGDLGTKGMASKKKKKMGR